MNTYLLLSPSEHRILGYITLGPKLSGTPGTPVFEVTSLFGMTEDIEYALIGYAMDVVRVFNEKVCRASINAKCRKEQFPIFSHRGFVRTGYVSGGYIRMQYSEFRRTAGSGEGFLLPRFRGRRLCSAIFWHLPRSSSSPPPKGKAFPATAWPPHPPARRRNSEV